MWQIVSRSLCTVRNGDSYRTNFMTHWPCMYVFTFLLTYSLTPWSRVLIKKLPGSQLVKKYPAFYGTQRYITALTSARQLSLS
jgi:hypothetical protein